MPAVGLAAMAHDSRGECQRAFRVDAAVVLMIDASGSTGRQPTPSTSRSPASELHNKQAGPGCHPCRFHGRIAIAAAVWSASPAPTARSSAPAGH